MWSINASELLQLKGAGGERFARFVDALIRQEARFGGLPQSEIDTQVRVNIPDGGVDTRVRGAVPDDASGWLGVPTCWQYKAQEQRDIRSNDLVNEINKSEVVKLIKRGYGFRFSFIGDLSPPKCAEWEQLLLAEAQRINPEASTPRVVAADKLAAWASCVPSMVAQLRPLPAPLLNLDAWRQQITAVTRKYVRVEQWADHAAAIRSHVTFEHETRQITLPVLGVAGVGKTRLVFEILAELEDAEALVVYVRYDKVAMDLAARLAGDRCSRAVLVVDECPPKSRLAIEENLGGCGHRVRVVCLDNFGTRSVTGAEEIWLEQIPEDVVRQVLAENFPNVPNDRRIAYATLARGFIRFAADLCNNDAQIRQGDLSPALLNVEDYIGVRVSDPKDTKVLDALALFPKVGARDDVSDQLANLCEVTGLEADQIHATAARLKDSPGFINIAGRYYYVTPMLVARVAFARGWQRWVHDNLHAFYTSLHPELSEGFLEQVRVAGAEEVKAKVADLFQRWVMNLKSPDLADPAQMERLSKLVEADPDRYLPLLRRVVEAASPQDLGAGKEAPHPMFGGSPARRALVWLAQRLAAFPEYYTDAEAILFRLALHECEPQIGNNATGVWRELYRTYLSGSAAPFHDRFAILESRIGETQGNTFMLCLSALASVFETEPTKMLGPAIVAGRLRPSDWRPKTPQEQRQCWLSALRVLAELSRSPVAERTDHAKNLTIDSLRVLLREGFLEQTQSILGKQTVDPNLRPRIIARIQDFLRWDVKDEIGTNESAKSYVGAVKEWLQSVEPCDFGGSLRTLISHSPWDEEIRSIAGDIHPDVLSLAEEACASPNLLDEQLGWLNSDEAASAPVFGDALARLDSKGVFIQSIFDAAAQSGHSALARGYVFGYVRSHDSAPEAMINGLDQLQVSQPRAAFDVLVEGGEALDGLQRATTLVDDGRIPAQMLISFAYRKGPHKPTAVTIKTVLDRLAKVAHGGDAETAKVILQFLAFEKHCEDRGEGTGIMRDSDVRGLAWDIVEAEQFLDTIDPNDWSETLKYLCSEDANRCARTLVRAVEEVRLSEEAERLLAALADDHPQAVIDSFGKALLHPERGLYLQVGTLKNLVSALPEEVVIEWLRKSGVEGARRLARHMPIPFTDEAGNPIVPSATDFMLLEFGSDKEVFNSFAAGTHGIETWSGNASTLLRAQAEEARRFLHHSNEYVRKWAAREAESREALAKYEQQEHEERFL